MNLKLKNQYNNWWRQKKTKEENINAAKRLYNHILNELFIYKPGLKNSKILDVGCGAGNFLVEAEKRELEIYGLDLSDYILNKAKKKVKGNFFIGNGEKLPFQTNEFDFVTCIGALEHFPHPDEGIKEIARVMKKNGVCLFHVPNLMFLGHIYMAYKYGIMPSENKQSFSEVFYTYKGWKNMIEKNGLEIVYCDVFNDMSETQRVNNFIKFLWQFVISRFVPFNLSYAFNFFCKKS